MVVTSTSLVMINNFIRSKKWVFGQLNFHHARSTPVEILLDNRLDKDFQKNIRPLRILQVLTCNLKYVIRDNYITSNSDFYNMLVMMSEAIYFMCTSYSLAVVVYAKDWRWYNSIFSFGDLFTVCLYNSGFFLNASITVTRSEHLVEVIIKMNKTFVTLKPVNYKHATTGVCIFISIMGFIAFGFNVISYLSSSRKFYAFSPIVTLQSLTFDFNMFYPIFFMNWLRKSVEIWIKEFDKCKSDDSPQSKIMRMDALLKTYDDILDSYNMIREYLQEMVSQ